MSVPTRNGRKDKPEPGGQGILAVERALHILELLAVSERGLSLSDIARALDVNKQIAFRLLETLENKGFVYKFPYSERFTLSYRIANLGHRKLIQEEIYDQAEATLREFADETGELVRLAVSEGQKLFWVLAVVGKKWMLNINPNYAPNITLHSTAAGKAWLSTKDPTEIDAVLATAPLVQRTPFTVTDPASLHGELEAVRRTGWALSFEESEIGIGAIAAPVVLDHFDGRRECVGTVSLSAPVQRMDRESLTQWAPRLLAATRHLALIWPRYQEPRMADREEVADLTQDSKRSKSRKISIAKRKHAS